MTEPDKTTAVAVQQRTSDGATELNRLLQKAYSPREDLLGDKFDRMQRLAELMSRSGVAVPAHLRDNLGACFAVVQQAMRWNADPWAVALKTHVVNEMVAYESQLIGAVLNASGAIRESAMQDEYFGPWEKIIGNFVERESRYKNPDGTPKTYRKLNTTISDEKGVGIRVWATLAGESAPRVLTLMLSQASVRNSTLWADDPQQQLFYLAQKRWARKYAPGTILGLYSADEIESETDLETGEIRTQPPLPPIAKPSQSAWPDDAFAARLPKWKEAITAGKTADDIIAFARSKGTLTEAQEAKIRALKPADSEPPSQPAPAEVDPFIADYDAAERGGA